MPPLLYPTDLALAATSTPTAPATAVTPGVSKSAPAPASAVQLRHIDTASAALARLQVLTKQIGDIAHRGTQAPSIAMAPRDRSAQQTPAAAAQLIAQALQHAGSAFLFPLRGGLWLTFCRETFALLQHLQACLPLSHGAASTDFPATALLQQLGLTAKLASAVQQAYQQVALRYTPLSQVESFEHMARSQHAQSDFFQALQDNCQGLTLGKKSQKQWQAFEINGVRVN